MLVYFGLIMIIATAVAMVKRIESRLVLIAAGFIMAIAALDPMAAFNGLSKGMTESNLICNICSVMAFAFVMKYTECDKHLSNAVAGPLRHVRLFLVPGATFVTFFVNISLPSAAGVAAAVGSIVIPLLINMGVRPAMAGAAVLMGTYGSILSPGLPHNPFVAKIATDVLGREVPTMEVITRHAVASVSTVVVAAIILWGISILRKEATGHAREMSAQQQNFKVNPFFAIIPIIPVAMLIMGALLPDRIPALAKLRVEHTMLFGAFLGLVATRKNPMDGSRQFFAGLGKGYADIMGIVIAAAVFVAGMKATGVVDAGIELMKTSQNAATIAACAGPWIMAVICGSGNAATIAFNEAVTINAPAFGVDVIDMGALATLAGCLGRCMSPIGGVTFVCAGLCGCNPMELVKRTFIPCIIGLIVGYFMLVGF
ncbi:MAG: C4-dicarboxylate transporter DcuC [Desulfovibrionaceae bacterium]|nr:C4-dicarboxylate transporter DcuC [Desulfovibrionaceae bacterium]